MCSEVSAEKHVLRVRLYQKQLADKLLSLTRRSASGRQEVHIVKDTALDMKTPCLYIACFDKLSFTDNSELEHIQNSELSVLCRTSKKQETFIELCDIMTANNYRMFVINNG